jgi:peptidoglycan/xylan/chitin deacetylase (PgdA/CDA1 family)
VTRQLTVLTYHRVDDPGARPDLDPGLISATPAEFERQVEWLARATTPVSLDDVLAVRRGEGTLPPRAVLVTFDDAYADFPRHAWPALRDAGVPVTVFVPTAYPGGEIARFWWDRLHHALAATTLRRPLGTPAGRIALATAEDRLRAHRLLVAWAHRVPHEDAMATVDLIVAALGEPPAAPAVLDWPALRELAAEGVVLAAHTQTHARLDRVGPARAREEIVGSLADLERRAGRPPPALAFPAGGHDEQARRIAGETGIELAFTTRRGANDLGRADWLALNRVNVGRRSTVPVLRAQLRRWPGRALSAVAVARTAL